ncbi:MAG: hypothetical protein HY471_01900 [Candidatus Sungbacteria bacterium]|nr:hypothetical protein [Candidatus Sungbacteria bacterium]
MALSQERYAPLPPGPLRVLTVDEIFQTLGVSVTSSDVTRTIQTMASDIASRFLSSRGGALLDDIKAKTGVDLVAFISFVWQVFTYLFIQIYAVLSDIANKFGAR